MVLSRRDIAAQDLPIYFLKPGEVHVRVGPCSATSLVDEKIPLDGRHYICAGEVILKSGKHLRAQFEIRTHTFDFLERSTVICTLDDEDWYDIADPALHQLLGLRTAQVFPYRWQPDRPLDYEPGPYAMHYPEEQMGLE